MSDQPEALRLADALARATCQVDVDDDVIHVARWFVEGSAAELRRQHAEIDRLRADAEGYRWQQVDAAIDAAIKEVAE